MEKSVDILKKCPLFAGMNPKEISDVTVFLNARKQTVDKNETVLNADRPVEKFGILLAGSVDVIMQDYWGNRTIMSRIAPSDIFAEAFACTQATHLPVFVSASEPSEILWIQADKMMMCLVSGIPSHARLIENMIRLLARKNVILSQKIKHVTQRTIREKLLSYLSLQAFKNGIDVFKIQFNRQELADYLAVDRSALSAELSRMQSDGLIRYHLNEFKLIGSKAIRTQG